jgi:Flp pilus assembly pilin Flp
MKYLIIRKTIIVLIITIVIITAVKLVSAELNNITNLFNNLK